ncbi:MAG: bifunctional phosphoribosyl-AMP cyclohydrolase/phosphoribosyl-ATP diphosphatase HisIE [Eubacteriales bacterium]|nr:bifunctional phosphoribosyl-AMP cyclohydrolase/phosphoribosyl-ATP diphosphatase HisIE [Eubacteriales bacterium]
MKAIKMIAAISKENAVEDTKYYDNCGADALFYNDVDSFKEGGEMDCKTIKSIYRHTSLPIYVITKIRHFDDIKKAFYAGADKLIISGNSRELKKAVREASERFGEDRLYKYMKATEIETSMDNARFAMNEGFGGIALDGDFTKDSYAALADRMRTVIDMPVFIQSSKGDPEFLAKLLKMTVPEGLLVYMDTNCDMMDLKQYLKKEGLKVDTFVSSMDFDDFKLNSDGMIPVVTQDYKTGEVLMVAYMTKESYEKTVETGKMTYFSRSRNELWCKGDTSGHYQYVKSLSIDCDNDTILAKVSQIGAACHTGNYSCFYRHLVKKDLTDKNILNVFTKVYDTILDRKENPKEGSYTNYLLKEGLDKILKKIGEEASEIIISSKNPDSDELTYEICDFIYHLMVLMCEKDITWQEIAEELSRRH